MLIGNSTYMDKADFKTINWGANPKNQHLVVRTLITKLVGKETLATHSLTGQPSNAHPEKEAKPALDDTIVKDVVGECDISAVPARLVLCFEIDSTYPLADPEGGGGNGGKVNKFAGQNVVGPLPLKTGLKNRVSVFKWRGQNTFWPANI